jgi:ankyrin repeat protein
LVEVKHADIETFDRGNFTPLLNAAWAGSKALVRFLMKKGADRSKIGRYHYTKPVAPIDFIGLTAEGWAEARGHRDVAKLLRLGL